VWLVVLGETGKEVVRVSSAVHRKILMRLARIAQYVSVREVGVFGRGSERQIGWA